MSGERQVLALHIELVRRSRGAQEVEALQFIAVNDTHVLAPYRQAALWLQGDGIRALSGVIEMERNAPYVQWLNSICARLVAKPAGSVTASDLPAELAAQWSDWLPAEAMWIPLAGGAGSLAVPPGGLLFARDEAWNEEVIAEVSDWIASWRPMYHALELPHRRSSWRTRWQRIRAGLLRRRLIWIAVAVLVLSLPVPLTVLAPGELVPSDPITIRAPLDGVVSQFHVKPNQLVKKGDKLFSFDDIALGSRYEVAQQALRTAEAELRQVEQQSMGDQRARLQLPSARGNVIERLAEQELLKSQRGRSEVMAPQDGYILFDDPAEWIGRPVTTGERVLRLAKTSDREIEAWLAVGDAIPLPTGASARLYLSAWPLDPVSGRVRYVSHEAVRRPDGIYAYRVRASLNGDSEHRVGLKGTVRLSGKTAPLAYWVLRRPLATIREFLGL